jgi:hypothetical protein
VSGVCEQKKLTATRNCTSYEAEKTTTSDSEVTVYSKLFVCPRCGYVCAARTSVLCANMLVGAEYNWIYAEIDYRYDRLSLATRRRGRKSRATG